MPKLEKGPIPLYYQLERILRSRIATKDIPPNGLLPTEMELCDEFEISRATVRQAIKALELDGLVRRTQGRGTIVIPQDQKKVSIQLYGSFEKIFQADKDYSTQLTSKKLITPGKEVMADMELDAGEKVYFLEAIRTNLVQQTVAYVQAHVPREIGAGISIKKNQSSDLLLRRVEALTGETPYRIVWRTKAVLADRKISEKLNIEPGSALLVTKRVYFARDGRTIERAVSYQPGDNFQMEIEMNMSGV